MGSRWANDGYSRLARPAAEGDWGTRMRFAILGPVEVSVDEHRLPLGGPQQRALLAVLLLHPGSVVSTDRLVEYLWGEQSPAAARSLLQGCVAGLRRAFKSGPAPHRQPLLTR